MIEEKLPISNALHSRVTRRLGYYPGAEAVRAAVSRLRDYTDADLLNRLREAEVVFESAGGRGVELADEIDRLRIVAAVRNIRPAKPARDDQAVERMQREHAVFRAVLEKLIDTVESTGGVVRTEKGLYEPAGDPDWIDLGDTYVQACAALGREPVVAPTEESNDEEPDDGEDA